MKACGKKFALILALPLLWYIFRENKAHLAPKDIVERIISAYTGDMHQPLTLDE